MGDFCGFPQDRKASGCAGACVYPDEYIPRQPKSTPLFRLLDSHYEEFKNIYDTRFTKRYGYWRSITDEVVEKYLRCGDPHYGFARIKCKECGAEYLRAFSCKKPRSITGDDTTPESRPVVFGKIYLVRTTLADACCSVLLSRRK